MKSCLALYALFVIGLYAVGFTGKLDAKHRPDKGKALTHLIRFCNTHSRTPVAFEGCIDAGLDALDG